MTLPWGPGPVFIYEWLLASRRWQLYAGRGLFLFVLLGALSIVWWSFLLDHPQPTLQDQANLGARFFYGLVGTQLVLVLLAAPAATAGAICVDKSRGTLAHLLVTDLSNTEIVLGKLASRLLPVLALIFGTLPVLALNVLLGGVDPLALAGAFLVTLGVAVLGCAVALTLSVWGNKTHEVLLINYLLWAILLLAYPTWSILNSEFGFPAPPFWLLETNPFWLAFGPYASPGTTSLLKCIVFLAVSAALSGVLALVAVFCIRSVAVRQTGRPSRQRRRLLGSLTHGLWRLLGPSLDGNPVLWREWHRRRPSRWITVIWGIYAFLAVLFSGLAVCMHLQRRGGREEFSALVNAFQVSIGLLLLSVTSSTSLAEERVRGTLDVLLTTPLPTRSIVWGKWWGAFRTVPLLALLPALTACPLAVDQGRWLGIPLLVALILAYGAALTSLGLALATWIQRLARAVTVSVIAYVLVTIAWPFVVFVFFATGDEAAGLISASPFWGMGFLCVWFEERSSRLEVVWVADVCWVVVYCLVALGLLASTLRTFNRCMGRITTGSRPRSARPTAGFAVGHMNAPARDVSGAEF